MPGSIRRMFPGGNTSEGFYSYYRYLLEKGTKRIFVLKGGPGVGKSTLMKKIGGQMVELGYDVELHHCSSDNNSLDGIVILEAGIVMVDGTAPHIVDPKYPGGLDEIINLGEFWNAEAMQLNIDRIKESTNEVSRLFARGYRFLKAARSIAEDISAMHSHNMDFASVNKVTGVIEKSILDPTYLQEDNTAVGTERHLFSCAYTPAGFIDYTDSILQSCSKVYYLEGAPGTGKSTLMSKIAARAVEQGVDVEIFHTPLIPDKIGTIIIKGRDIAITSSEKFKDNNDQAVNLNDFLNPDKIANYDEDIKSDYELLEDLINKGISCIFKAKAEHDVLEQFYIPHMNFAAAGEKYQKLMSRIINLTECKVTAASARVN